MTTYYSRSYQRRARLHRILRSPYARDVRAHLPLITDTIAGLFAAYLFVMLLRLLGVVLLVGAR